MPCRRFIGTLLVCHGRVLRDGYAQCLALRLDRAEQILPGIDEAFGALVLQLPWQARATSMPARVMLTSTCSASPPSRGIAWSTCAVVGERQQRLLRHGVDRVRRRQRADVEHVGGLRILGAGAGEQQALRARALAFQPLPAVGLQQVAIRLVALLGHRDAKPVAELAGHLLHRRLVPAADEHRGDRAHVGAQIRRPRGVPGRACRHRRPGHSRRARTAA